MVQINNRKKIAVTLWEHRVSPVFDSARTLLIAEIDGHSLIGTKQLPFDPENPLGLLRTLRTEQVILLICGAISENSAAMIESAGVELIPFIAGDIQLVLEYFLQSQSLGAQFKMPGCGKSICCSGKIRRGREIVIAQSNPDGGQVGQETITGVCDKLVR